MIRGYQKKIIFLKNINSRIFDQAQFIVSCENERKYSKREMMAEANRIIEENFSNSELNVNFLAEKLNISRSGLFAKIKTLADITPNEMIQIVRLKKAAQLLLERKYTVSEIGYMVGFSNPSYFSKCFQKQFGIKPADYMKSKQSL